METPALDARLAPPQTPTRSNRLAGNQRGAKGLRPIGHQGEPQNAATSGEVQVMRPRQMVSMARP